MCVSLRRWFVRAPWLIKGCLVLGTLGLLGNLVLVWRINTTLDVPMQTLSTSPPTCPVDRRGVVWIMARSVSDVPDHVWKFLLMLSNPVIRSLRNSASQVIATPKNIQQLLVRPLPID